MQAKLEYFGTKIDRRRSPIEGIGLFIQPWNRCREELWQFKGIIAMFIKRHQSKYHLCRICNSPGRREASGTSCKHIPDCSPKALAVCGTSQWCMVLLATLVHKTSCRGAPSSALCPGPGVRNKAIFPMAGMQGGAGNTPAHGTPCSRRAGAGVPWCCHPSWTCGTARAGTGLSFGGQWSGASLGLWRQLQPVSASGRSESEKAF